MIFFILQQWLKSLTELVVWARSQPQTFEENLEGRIDAEIEPGKVWRVRHLATFWAARSYKQSSFKIGEYIRVVERKGLVLFIEPLEKNEQQ
jgi:membrane protein implicated in regulation of membrane protease activity